MSHHIGNNWFNFSCISQNVQGFQKLGKLEEICTNITKNNYLFALLQETWRFNIEEFDVYDCKILHVGNEPPIPQIPPKKGRKASGGVAIVLSKRAIPAWNKLKL